MDDCNLSDDLSQTLAKRRRRSEEDEQRQFDTMRKVEGFIKRCIKLHVVRKIMYRGIHDVGRRGQRS